MANNYSEVKKIDGMYVRYNYSNESLEIISYERVYWDDKVDDIVCDKLKEPVVDFSSPLSLYSWNATPDYYMEQIVYYYNEEIDYAVREFESNNV